MYLLGLQLILNAEVNEYLDDIPESDGIRVAIHRSRTRPPVEEQGFTIPPLTTTSVNMRMVCANDFCTNISLCLRSQFFGELSYVSERNIFPSQRYVDRPGDPYVACRHPDAPKMKTRFAATRVDDPYAYSVSVSTPTV